jgi:hypothetical protein
MSLACIAPLSMLLDFYFPFKYQENTMPIVFKFMPILYKYLILKGTKKSWTLEESTEKPTAHRIVYLNLHFGLQVKLYL